MRERQSKMTYDEIKEALYRGARHINGAIVDIEQRYNHKWIAKVTYDGIYTEIEPIVSHHKDGCYDGKASFVDYLACELLSMINTST